MNVKRGKTTSVKRVIMRNQRQARETHLADSLLGWGLHMMDVRGSAKILGQLEGVLGET